MNEQTETEIAEQAVAEVIADSVGFEGSQVAVPKAVSTKDEEVADGEVRRSKRSKKLSCRMKDNILFLVNNFF